MVNFHAAQQVGYGLDCIEATVGAAASIGVGQGQLSNEAAGTGASQTQSGNLRHGVPVQVEQAAGIGLLIDNGQQQEVRLHFVGVGNGLLFPLKCVQAQNQDGLQILPQAVGLPLKLHHIFGDGGHHRFCGSLGCWCSGRSAGLCTGAQYQRCRKAQGERCRPEHSFPNHLSSSR